jgi:hypothetical protein
MPTENSKLTAKTNNVEDKRSGADQKGFDFDVTEWLEGERLEHEKRMRELGCLPCKTNKEHSGSNKHASKRGSMRTQAAKTQKKRLKKSGN